MQTKAPALASFVVRMTRSETGSVTGVVERVRTGVKTRFDSSEGLHRLITRVFEKDTV